MEATSPPPAVAPPADQEAQGRRGSGARPAAVLLVLLGVGVLAAAVVLRDRPVTATHYLYLSVMLFAAGAFGVLIRRNALVLFMCIELMLNATNLAFVAFARMHGRLEGQAIVLFVMIVAAAEVAVGLAIIVSIYRRRLSANVDDVSLLKW